ncbi:type IV pilin protein [Pseudomonadota bacterium]
MNNTKTKGFTLIEVMMVVAIVGILAMIAYPSYTDIIRKTNRADGMASLMKVMGSQERYYSEKNTYAMTLPWLGYDYVTATTQVWSTEEKYTLSATTCSTGGIDVCVKVVAEGRDGQENDTNCEPLTLNSRGEKTPAACW